MVYSASESFDTGVDTATAAGDYRVPFAVTGKLDQVVVTIDDRPLSDDHEKR